MHKNPQNHSFYIYFNSDSGDFHIQNQSFLFQVEFTTWQAVHFIYTHKMPSCLSGKSPKPSESIRNLLEPLYPMGYFNPIAIHFLYRFIFLLNFSESLSFFLSIYPFFNLVPSYMSLAWKDVCF